MTKHLFITQCPACLATGNMMRIGTRGKDRLFECTNCHSEYYVLGQPSSPNSKKRKHPQFDFKTFETINMNKKM